MSEERVRPQAPSGEQSGGGPRKLYGEPDAPSIGDWLQIEPDDTVTVFIGKAEMGQNTRTSLAQAVADELRLTIESIRMVLADTSRTPFDMGTFGSRSTPSMAPRLRKVAAATRELLRNLASVRLGVEVGELTVEAGRVVHGPSGRSLRIGEIAGGRRLAEPYEDAPTTPANRWTVAGTPAAKLNGRDFVTGRHTYTPDLQRPGMLVGKVLRPPTLGAKLVSADTSKAETLSGVTVVREGEFVGVTAPSRLLALRAVGTIEAEWRSSNDSVSSSNISEYLRSHPVGPQTYHARAAPSVDEVGDVDGALASAARTFEETYTVAYVAHAPLEMRAAVAEWSGDQLTVWTGTQRPFGVQSELAMAFRLPEEMVRVIVPDTGAAYGGKHTGDAAIEAARLARAAGKPVKVVWTREEEFTYAYFRPAGVIEIKSGIDGDGKLIAWSGQNFNSGPQALQPAYAIPNRRIVFQPSDSPLRQGSYRALAATANVFARETHVDEIANALGRDPLDFRLANLDDERLRVVLSAAAKKLGWGESKAQEGHGYGIACGTEKGSYVATCAEVEVDRSSGEVRVLQVVEAFECGAIVNPDNLTNQIEGCIVQGLGPALFEEVVFEDGKVASDRFSRYRVPRFSDLPKIDVVLLDRKDLPSVGAGETPIVGIAPAVGNAIFAATGIRLRSLPLSRGGIVGESAKSTA